jgi:transcriptional regulator with XRE-family HTH domain
VTQLLGDVIADQVRRFRKKRDLSVRELALKCAEIAPGTTLTQASLGNIERGQDPGAKRGRRDVSLGELLTIAAALRVPPVLLLCPLTSPTGVEVIPGMPQYPISIYEWLIGKAPMPGLGGASSDDGGAAYEAEFYENAYPLRLVTEHEATIAAAERALRHYVEVRTNLQPLRNDTAAAIERAKAASEDLREVAERLGEADREYLHRLEMSRHAGALAEIRVRDFERAAEVADTAKAELRTALEAVIAIRTSMKNLGMVLFPISRELFAATHWFEGMHNYKKAATDPGRSDVVAAIEQAASDDVAAADFEHALGDLNGS